MRLHRAGGHPTAHAMYSALVTSIPYSVSRARAGGASELAVATMHRPCNTTSIRQCVTVAARRGGSSGTLQRPNDPEAAAGGVVEDRELHVEASESYLAYAMSVIVGRALPDVRDGLKPVHRRILYAMHELGLTHTKPFKKCARVVGEVLGKFHPHGDTAVYDALVRLAQDFSMRHTLISGHGNFGSLDDDPPAAMRYTECRLQALASDTLLADLDQDVVDFNPTFDASQEEPGVLPARIPLLLVNGTQGIAVGIATKIPPHNLREVVAGLAALIHNPDITVPELRAHIPGPDFPTGNIVSTGPGADAMYATGNGYVLLRATVDIEEGGDGEEGEASGRRRRGATSAARAKLVIQDVPYQTSKAEIVESIAALVESKVLEGVADVRDESDRTGTRVVVEVKPGVLPGAVLAALYRHTRLQSKYAANMVALVGGTPRQLDLKAFLQHFLDFRCEVILRRTKHRANAAARRLALVQGLLVAMQNADRVVQIIRGASSTEAARVALAEQLALNREQADAVLAMPLRRLARSETAQLEAEAAQLSATIADLRALLDSRTALLACVEQEARTIAEVHGNPRRTQIVPEEDLSEAAASEAPEGLGRPVVVAGSSKGFVQRLPLLPDPEPDAPKPPEVLPGVRAGDRLQAVLRVPEQGPLLVVTPQGRAYRLAVSAVPEKARGAPGVAAAQLVGSRISMPIAGLAALPTLDALEATPAPETSPAPGLPSDSTEDDGGDDGVVSQGEEGGAGGGVDESVPEPAVTLVLVTAQGHIKRTPVTASFARITRAGSPIIKMKADDEVVFAGLAGPGDHVLLARNDGRVVVYPLAEVRPTARNAGPIVGMRLNDGQRIAGAAVVPADPAATGEPGIPESLNVLVVTSNGRAKNVPVHYLGVSGRGQVGATVMYAATSRLPDEVVGVAVAPPDGQVLLQPGSGAPRLLRLADVPEADLSDPRATAWLLGKAADITAVLPWPADADV